MTRPANHFSPECWKSKGAAVQPPSADQADAIAGRQVPPPLPRRAADDRTLTEAELACSYKLARHVPDMARGFTICTSYGEMRIGGALARRVQEMVREALAVELAGLGSRRNGGHA